MTIFSHQKLNHNKIIIILSHHRLTFEVNKRTKMLDKNKVRGLVKVNKKYKDQNQTCQKVLGLKT